MPISVSGFLKVSKLGKRQTALLKGRGFMSNRIRYINELKYFHIRKR